MPRSRGPPLVGSFQHTVGDASSAEARRAVQATRVSLGWSKAISLVFFSISGRPQRRPHLGWGDCQRSVTGRLRPSPAQTLHKRGRRSAPARGDSAARGRHPAQRSALSGQQSLPLHFFPSYGIRSAPPGSMTPLKRLMAVHQRMDRLKESPDIWVNYMALDMFTNLLPAPLARRALNTHGVTLVASNLVGPQETIHMFGGAVDDIMFWIPNKSRTGVGVSMLSYRGQVRLGLNIDTALLKSEEDAQRLLEDTVVQTKALLTGLGAVEEEPANSLLDTAVSTPETELLLEEGTQLRPNQSPRARPATLAYRN
ncbi:hypothetical protein GWK47_030712 [Chionoecetes opilio]|uniref:O-acyltransferase WSD1 C-terminal domain-containing protein n=1 Tax=Chionoecetes opilio TaxID=41210 RepID=A0A8J4YJX3_CHIOP|nr:hypothetical protein GWK47_030712 [Chionoecetes opilio]